MVMKFYGDEANAEQDKADQQTLEDTIKWYQACGLSKDDAIIVVERARKAALDSLDLLKKTCLDAPTDELQLYTLQLALTYVSVNARMAARSNAVGVLLNHLLGGSKL